MTATATARTRMVSKPYDLARVYEQAAFAPEETVAIDETVALTAAAYDQFTAAFFAPHPWLAGRGGERNGARLVIRVTAPGRQTLLVDASGYDYARYVGVAREPAPG